MAGPQAQAAIHKDVCILASQCPSPAPWSPHLKVENWGSCSCRPLSVVRILWVLPPAVEGSPQDTPHPQTFSDLSRHRDSPIYLMCVSFKPLHLTVYLYGSASSLLEPWKKELCLNLVVCSQNPAYWLPYSRCLLMLENGC